MIISEKNKYLNNKLYIINESSLIRSKIRFTEGFGAY